MTFQRDISDPPLPDHATLGEWALFLDLDGTLIDLAPTPDSVVVPPDLIETLAVLEQTMSGALAIVSGRSLGVIDRLLAPLRLAAAAEHGAVIRAGAHDAAEAGGDMAVPASWRRQLRQLAQQWPGALVEEKPNGIAVHYRANPALEEMVSTALAAMVAGDSSFEVLPAAMAREIRHRDANKGAGLQRLMRRMPFAARRPLFIGDDVTDEDAIAAAQALGGIGLRVPDHFGGAPARVRAWLCELAGRG
ncbi:trehalose-phosphatase [Dongia mobilis]|nr:trehalose-phosphatase [Dongia mobilis]